MENRLLFFQSKIIYKKKGQEHILHFYARLIRIKYELYL